AARRTTSWRVRPGDVAGARKLLRGAEPSVLGHRRPAVSGDITGNGCYCAWFVLVFGATLCEKSAEARAAGGAEGVPGGGEVAGPPGRRGRGAEAVARGRAVSSRPPTPGRFR